MAGSNYSIVGILGLLAAALAILFVGGGVLIVLAVLKTLSEHSVVAEIARLLILLFPFYGIPILVVIFAAFQSRADAKRRKTIDLLVGNWREAHARLAAMSSETEGESAGKTAESESQSLELQLARWDKVVCDLFELRSDSGTRVGGLEARQFENLLTAVCQVAGEQNPAALHGLLAVSGDAQLVALRIAPRAGKPAAALIPEILSRYQSSSDEGFRAKCRLALEQIATQVDPEQAEPATAVFRAETMQQREKERQAAHRQHMREMTCEHRWRISTWASSTDDETYTSRVCAKCGRDESSGTSYRS